MAIVIDIDYTTTGFQRHKLFTAAQYDKLEINGMMHNVDHDAIPCVYLLGSRTSFLLSEICANKPGVAYGLYYELNVPTLGYISLDSIFKYHDDIDFLFNDRVYEADYRISVFKKVADELGKIVPSDEFIEHIFEKYNY